MSREPHGEFLLCLIHHHPIGGKGVRDCDSNGIEPVRVGSESREAHSHESEALRSPGDVPPTNCNRGLLAQYLRPFLRISVVQDLHCPFVDRRTVQLPETRHSHYQLAIENNGFVHSLWGRRYDSTLAV
jgi:hypothetical protein